MWPGLKVMRSSGGCAPQRAARGGSQAESGGPTIERMNWWFQEYYVSFHSTVLRGSQKDVYWVQLYGEASE